MVDALLEARLCFKPTFGSTRPAISSPRSIARGSWRDLGGVVARGARRNVRGDGDAGVMPERMFGRQRFGAEHVSVAPPAGRCRAQPDVGVDQVRAAPAR